MNMFSGEADKLKAEEEAKLKEEEEALKKKAEEEKEKQEKAAKELAMKVFLYKFFYCCMSDPMKDVPTPSL